MVVPHATLSIEAKEYAELINYIRSKLIIKKLDIKKGFIFVLILLFFDQFLKFYIKLNFPLTLYDQPAIIDLGFFKLLFIENEGMAMGARLNNIFPFLE